MNDSVFLIKLTGDKVKILSIARLVSSKYGVGDVVSELNHARCLRINEEGRIS